MSNNGGGRWIVLPQIERDTSKYWDSPPPRAVDTIGRNELQFQPLIAGCWKGNKHFGLKKNSRKPLITFPALLTFVLFLWVLQGTWWISHKDPFCFSHERRIVTPFSPLTKECLQEEILYQKIYYVFSESPCLGEKGTINNVWLQSYDWKTKLEKRL